MDRTEEAAADGQNISTEMTKPKSKKKVIVTSIVTGALLLGAGGGTAFGITSYNAETERLCTTATSTRGNHVGVRVSVKAGIPRPEIGQRGISDRGLALQLGPGTKEEPPSKPSTPSATFTDTSTRCVQRSTSWTLTATQGPTSCSSAIT